ncbi:MAG: hypothetical protein JXP73_20610 [Deltaproteobacteria bacterium]|jgi:hypothetical protein|nr:hypothetical protein [Deltaproteobacteria bacterium]
MAKAIGRVIATMPRTEIGDAEAWHAYAMGDAADGYALMPAKLRRT